MHWASENWDFWRRALYYIASSWWKIYWNCCRQSAAASPEACSRSSYNCREPHLFVYFEPRDVSLHFWASFRGCMCLVLCIHAHMYTSTYGSDLSAKSKNIQWHQLLRLIDSYSIKYICDVEYEWYIFHSAEICLHDINVCTMSMCVCMSMYVLRQCVYVCQMHTSVW